MRSGLMLGLAPLLLHVAVAPFGVAQERARQPNVAARKAFTIDADYPGGNVRVVRREGDTFVVAPDLRDTQPGVWWFYYNFRLRGPAGQPATIVFEDRNPIGVRGPAVSVDGGRTWTWLGYEAVTESKTGSKTSWSFPAVVPLGATEARFAFAPPYQQSHLREWLNVHQDNPALKVEELCRSRKDRAVELLRAGCLDESRVKGVVLLTSRHHACESIATYAMEGILTAVLAEDELGRRWRKQWQIAALPFTDKDGVEDGDQGKNRSPHDHNRDYNDKPLYPEVAAWMKRSQSLGPKVVFSLDMHCPYIRGQWNDRVYIVGGAKPEFMEREREFVTSLARVRQGPIPFHASECYLPHGVAWNKTANYAAGRSNGAWSRDAFPDARFCGTIEIAYASALGEEVTADSARRFGRDLASAILEHIER
nr:hypothetical protein [Planctomycetota bacterium]